MPWQISVVGRAKAAIRSLDPTLKEELIRQVERVSESPADFLTRAPEARRFAATHVYTYRSEVVLGLRVSLYLRGWDDNPARLDLVAIGQVIESNGTDE